ncbi:MAG TPA: type II toxin-antitoxin system VapC family toxin [Streptosporangiaceae bacterium]|nr:type II toxin-antitoxin system VapC family toxin [Streptosporangiaceae bacterium]
MRSPDARETLVLDSGALIAMERSSPRLTEMLFRVRRGDARVIIPDAVLAQVWRGGTGRQARMASLLKLNPEQCMRMPLETGTAKQIGMKSGACDHSDVVDVHVALLAEEYGAAVVTSDREDILAVSPDLKDTIVDV